MRNWVAEIRVVLEVQCLMIFQSGARLRRCETLKNHFNMAKNAFFGSTFSKNMYILMFKKFEKNISHSWRVLPLTPFLPASVSSARV